MNGKDLNNTSVELSIVIPAYNEADCLLNTIGQIRLFCEGRFGFEIIVVDDGSNDGTPEILKSISEDMSNLRVIRNPANMGKGFSARAGVEAAKGKMILLSDADHSVGIGEVPPLIACLEDGWDMAIASRYMDQSVFLRPMPVRAAMGRVFNFAARILFGFNYKDTQCGFKLMDARAAKEVFRNCKINRFAFDVEALFWARKLDMKVIEKPVVCENSPHTKIRLFRDSVNMLADIILLKLRFPKG